LEIYERRRCINRFNILNDFQSETDRGAALVGAAMVGSRLERILRFHLLENASSDDLLEGVMLRLELLV